MLLYDVELDILLIAFLISLISFLLKTYFSFRRSILSICSKMKISNDCSSQRRRTHGYQTKHQKTFVDPRKRIRPTDVHQVPVRPLGFRVHGQHKRTQGETEEKENEEHDESLVLGVLVHQIQDEQQRRDETQHARRDHAVLPQHHRGVWVGDEVATTV